MLDYTGFSQSRRLPGYHAPPSSSWDSVFVSGFDGVSMPCDCLVDPVVMTCRIPVRVLTTDRCIGDALLALIHQAINPPRSSHASVTALSMMCCWTLLQCGQVNVRRSLSASPGSIAVNFMGEPQAVHCGPWFCVSSMGCFPQFGVLSSPASQPTAFDLKGSDAMTLIST